MSGPVIFTVPGPIQGKGRPRFVRATGRIHTPAKTLSYEGKIAHLAGVEMHGRELFERSLPLACTVVATVSPPASWSKKKAALALDGLVRPTTKPDGDNILKVLGDALNGVVWQDDVSVVEWRLSKIYGAREGLCVAVEPIDTARMLMMLERTA